MTGFGGGNAGVVVVSGVGSGVGSGFGSGVGPGVGSVAGPRVASGACSGVVDSLTKLRNGDPLHLLKPYSLKIQINGKKIQIHRKVLTLLQTR